MGSPCPQPPWGEALCPVPTDGRQRRVTLSCVSPLSLRDGSLSCKVGHEVQGTLPSPPGIEPSCPELVSKHFLGPHCSPGSEDHDTSLPWPRVQWVLSKGSWTWKEAAQGAPGGGQSCLCVPPRSSRAPVGNITGTGTSGRRRTTWCRHGEPQTSESDS